MAASTETDTLLFMDVDPHMSAWSAKSEWLWLCRAPAVARHQNCKWPRMLVGLIGWSLSTARVLVPPPNMGVTKVMGNRSVSESVCAIVGTDGQRGIAIEARILSDIGGINPVGNHRYLRAGLIFP